MPPQRTIPPAKAIKTERTHEENQERAYIAASRRSDRSLEARVESARRASEIHKRRTGRSLRVTEQDVVNEEMYEEEDDDLPMQYRRLTAHLQTGSAEFNRRLTAYLTNHVAMRSALDDAITNSYHQQYPNAPQFAHNQRSTFPSPMIPQAGMLPHSPHSYRQSPYPAPTQRPPPSHPHHSAHVRSTSIAGPHDTSRFAHKCTPSSQVDIADRVDQRRMSMPAPIVSPIVAQTPQINQVSMPKAAHPQKAVASPQHSKQDEQKQQPQYVKKEDLNTQVLAASPAPPQQRDNGLLSFSLPAESQQLLGQALDPNDPFTAMLMGGNQSMLPPYYGFDPSFPSKSSNFHPSFDGMSSTLAPSALDMSADHLDYTNQPSTSSNPDMPVFNLGFDSILDANAQHLTSSNSALRSGTVTPGNEGGWDLFINDNPWFEHVS